MLPLTIHFEMTDATASQAAREDCLVAAREYCRDALKPLDILITVASAAVFIRALIMGSHWIWWFAGIPFLIPFGLAAGWGLAYLWLPRHVLERLRHLPHRRVEAEMTEERISFQSANEKIELIWSELVKLKELPGFWLFCLRNGARIPVPKALLNEEVVTHIRGRITPPAAKK